LTRLEPFGNRRKKFTETEVRKGGCVDVGSGWIASNRENAPVFVEISGESRRFTENFTPLVYLMAPFVEMMTPPINYLKSGSRLGTNCPLCA
jgi:hypothetical protein